MNIISPLGVIFIVAVLCGATIHTITNYADDTQIKIVDIENDDNQNTTGSSFDIFNDSNVQDFLSNITISKLPPIPTPRKYNEAMYGGGSSVVQGMQIPSCYDSYSLNSLGKTGTIGFSVGGAKDINNFRENILWGYLPMVTDITYEGLFYDYYFNTGERKPCDELFYPSYSYAITINPLTGEKEYYLTVGLNSGIQQSEFHRKNLNLVIVLDISGSMSSSFNRYYYNSYEYVDPKDLESDWNKTKIEVARESILALLDHLTEDDRLGIVLFNRQASVMEQLSLVKNKNMDLLKQQVLEINSDGGTNMDAGMQQATELLQSHKNSNTAEYENRIIFLTDAQPNCGDTSKEGFIGRVQQNSHERIYSTFIGVGVDFNSQLIELITKTRGANYCSVHSSSEFMHRMDDEFEYMVTPLVFNLKMKLLSDGYEILEVYGSPEANESTGQLMKVSTLFPSAKVDNETKGGIIVLQLEKLSSNASLYLELSYEDRNGQMFSHNEEVTITEQDSDYFQNSGIRKGILLVRYVTLLKKWITYQWNQTESSYVSQWERKSLALRVSDEFKQIFSKFSKYFQSEMNALDDKTLQQELDLLKYLGSLDTYETKLTEANNYDIISVEPGTIVNVTLDIKNGCTWKIKDHDDSIIYLTESYCSNNTEQNQSHVKTWIFQAENTGNTTLSIECIEDEIDDDFSTHLIYSVAIEVV